jgi:hypothetical protein
MQGKEESCPTAQLRTGGGGDYGAHGLLQACCPSLAAITCGTVGFLRHVVDSSAEAAPGSIFLGQGQGQGQAFSV